MFRTARMEKVNMMVLNKDLYQVTRRLGQLETVQLIPEDEVDANWNKEDLEQTDQALAMLSNLAKGLKLDLDARHPTLLPAGALDPQESEQYLRRLQDQLTPLAEERTRLGERRSEMERGLGEISGFRELDLDFSRINSVSFLFFRYGSVPQPRFAELQAVAGERVILLRPPQKLAQANRIPVLAITSKKGRFAMETALDNCGFQEIVVPEQLAGVPSLVIKEIEEKLHALDEELDALDRRLDRMAEEALPLLLKCRAALEEHRTILAVMQGFAHTQYTSTIQCWMPRAAVPRLERELEELIGEKIVLERQDPLRLPPEERKKYVVPVLLHNRGFIKPFEPLISNYGYPRYGEIEPTPIVALGFIIMFGIMFGDVGQGGVLVLAGLILSLQKKLQLGLRRAGLLVAYAGFSAVFFGLVYGSFFCDPHVIPALWKEPLQDVMTVFGATVAFGILWINTGLFLNILNKIRFRDAKEAIFEKTGLFGVAFYWGILISVIGNNLFKLQLSLTAMLLMTCVPLFLLFIREPLYNLFARKPLFEHGLLSFFMEGIVEVIDTLSYFLGNTFSFVRLGAFALAHSGLSLAVMKLAGLAGGGPLAILIMILGNLLIIVLEGMVVTIQTLRLEYYEFFSKFYSGSGRPFTPFSLPKAGGT